MFLAQHDERPLIEFTLAPLFDEQGIALALMGILVVFVALVLVATFIKFLPQMLASISAGASEQSGISPAVDELSEETLVVIAAAVAETIREPHRIVRIRGLTPENLGWSLEGRMQHHQSHRIQPRERR